MPEEADDLLAPPAEGYRALPPDVLPPQLRDVLGSETVYHVGPVTKVTRNEREQERALVITADTIAILKGAGVVARMLPLAELDRIFLKRPGDADRTRWRCALVPREGSANPSVMLLLSPTRDPLRPLRVAHWLAARTGSQPSAVLLGPRESMRTPGQGNFAKTSQYMTKAWLQQHAAPASSRAPPPAAESPARDSGLAALSPTPGITNTVRLSFPGERVGFDVREAEDLGGVTVISVAPGSPAEAAGVQTGAVVTKLGGIPVRTVEDLQRAVRELQLQQQTTFPIEMRYSTYMPAPAATLHSCLLPVGVPLGLDVACSGRGMQVIGVEPSSAAAEAGLTADSMLYTLDGQELSTLDDLRGIMAAAEAEGRGTVTAEYLPPARTFQVSLQRPGEPIGFTYWHEADAQGAHRVRVTDINPSSPLGGASPAHRAGLVPGTLIAVDGLPVQSADDLHGAVRSARAQGRTDLSIALLPASPEEEVPPPPAEDLPPPSWTPTPPEPSDSASASTPLPRCSYTARTPADWPPPRPRQVAAHIAYSGTVPPVGKEQDGLFGEMRSYTVVAAAQQPLGVELAPGGAGPLRIISVDADSPCGRAGVPRGWLRLINGRPATTVAAVQAALRKAQQGRQGAKMSLVLSVEPWLGLGVVPQGEGAVSINTGGGHCATYAIDRPHSGALVELVDGARVGTTPTLRWDAERGSLSDHRGAGTVLPRGGREALLRRLARLADCAGVSHSIPRGGSAPSPPAQRRASAAATASPADSRAEGSWLQPGWLQLPARPGRGATRRSAPPATAGPGGGTERGHGAGAPTTERAAQESTAPEALQWYREHLARAGAVRDSEAAAARREREQEREMAALREEAAALRERRARLDERALALEQREAAAGRARDRLAALAADAGMREQMAELGRLAEDGAAEVLARELGSALLPPADERRVFALLRGVRSAAHWAALCAHFRNCHGRELTEAMEQGLTAAEVSAAARLLQQQASLAADPFTRRAALSQRLL